MMRVVLIAEQVAMVLEEFIEEGEVMTKEELQLGFVFMLKLYAVG